MIYMRCWESVRLLSWTRAAGLADLAVRLVQAGLSGNDLLLLACLTAFCSSTMPVT